MTNRERENTTLSFFKPSDRGSVEETFYPWTLTVERFEKEGMPSDIASKTLDIVNNNIVQDVNIEKYLNVAWGEGVLAYENYLGFDPVRRISFTLPFRRPDKKFTEKYGRFITSDDDWKRLKEYGEKELENYYSDENIINSYSPLKEKHERGDYSVRLYIEGFFWTPRELIGIEPHMYSFYDTPELLHNICEFSLKIYLEKLTKVLDVIPADVIYLMEDLSGKNGPMISPELFDEFVGSYYQRFIPVLKQKGVRHVFVDTDGDFKKLIPNFIKAGVEGFLPMDVNAGMDIVAVRKEFPNLKFIGGYNKLWIAEGREAIDREFERLLPVIRQGGYIPGADHQVAPSTSLENYKYYITKLKEVMLQCGADL